MAQSREVRLSTAAGFGLPPGAPPGGGSRVAPMPGTWRGNVYLVVSFFMGLATFTFLVTAILLGVGLLIVWVGVPILLGTLWATRGLAALERRRAGWLLAETIPSAYLPPHRPGILGRLHAALSDGATWKDLLWLLVVLPVLGLAGFTLAVSIWGAAIGTVLMPAWYWSIPDPGIDWGLFTIDTLGEALAVVPVGLVLIALAVPVTRASSFGVASVGRALLAPSERRRVEQLERTRAGAVDSQAAELQRIERDLHDGAQARLVALAMDLGMAQEKLASDPAGAQALVAGAHTEAKRALAELRDLSRGIYPAILTDRGLGPALSSIAAGNPVEVALEVDLDERLPAATEAAAYFVAVEALTNVAKHSGAEHCRVRIARRGGRLRVEVADDGHGGADPGGAGLTGLRQRVEALDGTLLVQTGELGTTIRAELPCAW
jgi:signal transduction histidine kinase